MLRHSWILLFLASAAFGQSAPTTSIVFPEPGQCWPWYWANGVLAPASGQAVTLPDPWAPWPNPCPDPNPRPWPPRPPLPLPIPVPTPGPRYTQLKCSYTAEVTAFRGDIMERLDYQYVDALPVNLEIPGPVINQPNNPWNRVNPWTNGSRVGTSNDGVNSASGTSTTSTTWQLPPSFWPGRWANATEWNGTYKGPEGGVIEIGGRKFKIDALGIVRVQQNSWGYRDDGGQTSLVQLSVRETTTGASFSAYGKYGNTEGTVRAELPVIAGGFERKGDNNAVEWVSSQNTVVSLELSCNLQ